MKIREQLKALTGGVVAGLGALVTALSDASIVAQEWAVVALAAATAYAGVYRIRQPAQLDSLPALTSTELFKLAERAQDRERAEREASA